MSCQPSHPGGLSIEYGLGNAPSAGVVLAISNLPRFIGFLHPASPLLSGIILARQSRGLTLSARALACRRAIGGGLLRVHLRSPRLELACRDARLRGDRLPAA